MRKDRNCMMNSYPNYQSFGNMPVMPIPNMMGPMPGVMPQFSVNTTTTGNDNIEKQINMLERRVTKLETLINSSSTYNNFDSNYHVM